MKNTTVVIALCMAFVVLFALLCKHEAWGEVDICRVPSSAVKITVKQDRDKSIYEFTVTNFYTEPIYFFLIGCGPKGGLRHLDNLVPREFMSPDGWRGRLAGVVESPYMCYSWGIKTVEEKIYDIKPGMTLSGFKLVMSEPLDIIKFFPFEVGFRGMQCAYGTVVEEK